MANEQRPNNQNQPKQAAPSVMAEPPQATRKTWAEEAKDYLLDNNWKLVSVNDIGQSTWSDPNGVLGGMNKGEKPTFQVFTLPTRDGGHETVRQAVVPAVAWDYSLEDAMRIQKQRDAAAAKKAQQPVQKSLIG